MYDIDRECTTRYGREAVLDVAVCDLYETALRVRAREYAHHRHALDAFMALSRDTPWPDLKGARDAARAQLCAYVTAHDDVATEANNIMTRLEAMLKNRGACIIARGPHIIRCTEWFRRSSDWLDAAIGMGYSRLYPHRPTFLLGGLFGEDYVACVYLVRPLSY